MTTHWQYAASCLDYPTTSVESLCLCIFEYNKSDLPCSLNSDATQKTIRIGSPSVVVSTNSSLS